MAKYIVTHGIRIAQDFVPETFGRLTTLGPKFKLSSAKDSPRDHAVYQCSCGCVCVKQCRFVETGRTTSCGCYLVERIKETQTKHGHRVRGNPRSAEMDAYFNMRSRCYHKNNTHYADYGGRGIRVFPEWLGDTGFETWLAYMGERPSKDHSIDRIDNDGHYGPGNVRWATREEQANNKRNNRFLEFRGKSQTVAQWARELGIKRTTIKDRLASGWTVAAALSLPTGQKTGPKPRNTVDRH